MYIAFRVHSLSALHSVYIMPRLFYNFRFQKRMGSLRIQTGPIYLQYTRAVRGSAQLAPSRLSADDTAWSIYRDLLTRIRVCNVIVNCQASAAH